jgi:type II secretory ATPase GspE/PulE/Tfp pilus assembly ATPase PilB-like protein
VPKIDQKQVSEQLTHAVLLRALLRQDPNVMLVGELRDRETGSMIVAGAHGVKLWAHARAHGFRTLVEDALDKIAAGLTTVDELVRVVPYRQVAMAREERRAALSAGAP